MRPKQRAALASALYRAKNSDELNGALHPVAEILGGQSAAHPNTDIVRRFVEGGVSENAIRTGAALTLIGIAAAIVWRFVALQEANAESADAESANAESANASDAESANAETILDNFRKDIEPIISSYIKKNAHIKHLRDRIISDIGTQVSKIEQEAIAMHGKCDNTDPLELRMIFEEIESDANKVVARIEGFREQLTDHIAEVTRDHADAMEQFASYAEKVIGAVGSSDVTHSALKQLRTQSEELNATEAQFGSQLATLASTIRKHVSTAETLYLGESAKRAVAAQIKHSDKMQGILRKRIRKLTDTLENAVSVEELHETRLALYKKCIRLAKITISKLKIANPLNVAAFMGVKGQQPTDSDQEFREYLIWYPVFDRLLWPNSMTEESKSRESKLTGSPKWIAALVPAKTYGGYPSFNLSCIACVVILILILILAACKIVGKSGKKRRPAWSTVHPPLGSSWPRAPEETFC